MLEEEPLRLYLVDREDDTRTHLVEALGDVTASIRSYHSAESFLTEFAGKPGVLVTEIQLPGMSGPELCHLIREQGHYLPTVVLTPFSSFGQVVEGMRNGASSYVRKPFSREDLSFALHLAIEDFREGLDEFVRKKAFLERLSELKPQELQVLDQLMAGRLNKQIASDLGVSMRTVESRRKSIMEKTQVKNIHQLFLLMVNYR